MQRNYYVAINSYRSSTDAGFANTWDVFLCRDAAQQHRILRDGLPVRDIVHLQNGGSQSPVYSTIGIRAATRAEKRLAAQYPELMSAIDEQWDV